jgi:hypothetical protein
MKIGAREVSQEYSDDVGINPTFPFGFVQPKILSG